MFIDVPRSRSPDIPGASLKNLADSMTQAHRGNAPQVESLRLFSALAPLVKKSIGSSPAWRMTGGVRMAKNTYILVDRFLGSMS